MGFSRHYLKDNNFMFTRITGEVNDQNLRQHVIDLNRESEGISDLRELADCTGIKSMENLTVKGTSGCADLENNRPNSLLAILVTDSALLYGMARAYQAFSEDRRESVQIFKDKNEALAWLANDDAEIEVFNKFINNA